MAKDEVEDYDDIRIRRVQVLGGRARKQAQKMKLKDDDLVLVKTKIQRGRVPTYTLEKVEGSPVEYLQRKFLKGGKSMSENDMNVEVNLDVLKAVAKYYEFPLAVFFTPLSKWRKGHTRLNDLRNVAEKYKRIRAIVEEDDE